MGEKPPWLLVLADKPNDRPAITMFLRKLGIDLLVVIKIVVVGAMMKVKAECSNMAAESIDARSAEKASDLGRISEVIHQIYEIKP